MTDNIGKHTDLGKIIYENSRVALTVAEDSKHIHVYVLQKDSQGKLRYPLGFILGSSAMSFEYKKEHEPEQPHHD